MTAKLRSVALLLGPALLLMLVVAIWPLARSLWFGFTETNINDLSVSRWVGLENYIGEYGLFFNPNDVDGFWLGDWGVSIRNTFAFALISVSLETIFGLFVALLLHREFPGRALVRTAVLVPWALPTVVSAKMWHWMLHDQFGVINAWLLDLGIVDEKIAFTADPTYAFWTVVAVDVWKTTPFMALLILAALQSLPKDCYEAAKIDGVHPLRLFLRVTLPLIRPALMVAIMFRLLDALRIFDLVFILTANSTDTLTMSGFVRREMIDHGHIGFGSAASSSLFLIILLTAIVFVRASRLRLAERV